MMSGFGIDPFSQFADEPDATEDPFGIAASARETQWWTPYGSVAPRRKKRSGLDGWNQEGPPPSFVRPPAATTPSPSTTQRVILDQKQGDESIARLLGGGAPRDTGAGDDDAFSRDNQTFLAQRYQAPDPTNPGQQDQARSATVDNAALDEWRDSMKKAKELEDQALALPPRTGFGGIYDDKRARLYEGARVLRQRAAYAAASAPSSQLDPSRLKTVGNLMFDPALRRPDGGLGDYVYPDPEKLKAMHRASGGATPAPHLETLIEPRTGNSVRVDPAAVPKNAHGQLVERWFQKDPKLQGPTRPGVAELGETKEEPYGVPAPAVVQAAEYRHENPAPEKAPKEPTVNPLSAAQEKRKIREDYNDKIEKVSRPERGSYWSDKTRAAEAQKEIARLKQEMQDRLDEIDAVVGGGGKKKGAPSPKSGPSGGSVGGVKWRKVG